MEYPSPCVGNGSYAVYFDEDGYGNGNPNVGNIGMGTQIICVGNVMGSDIWACICTKVNETRTLVK
jgi:hypothetical protein